MTQANRTAFDLTHEELRLMPYLPTQLSFAQIGDELHVPGDTVRRTVIVLYRKMGVVNRAEAVAAFYGTTIST